MKNSHYKVFDEKGMEIHTMSHVKVRSSTIFLQLNLENFSMELYALKLNYGFSTMACLSTPPPLLSYFVSQATSLSQHIAEQ